MTKRSAKVVPATEDHVDLILADGLRQADVDELAAIDRTPSKALWDSFYGSQPHVFTILIDGHPAAIFGVCEAFDGPYGIPWMLGTDRLLLIRRELVVEARPWIAYLNELYDPLVNFVDRRNFVSVRWLKAMGFDFPGPDLELANGAVFRRFIRCVTR